MSKKKETRETAGTSKGTASSPLRQQISRAQGDALGPKRDDPGPGGMPGFVPYEQPQTPPAVGVDELRRAREILRRYKDGKKMLEEKIVRNEKWFKMRHWDLLKTEETLDDPKPASGWLFNCIISKHADFMDSYPSASILPREIGDQEEAQKLSSILPVVLEQNEFEAVYSEEVWYKLKHGTGVFGVFWDGSKLGGLGDISIRPLDLLNLFWQPGVTDIQKSEHFFSVELVDNDRLEEQYPHLRGKLHKDTDTLLKKYWYDENISTTGKSAVIDWYYHKTIDGKRTLQYCKFVDEEVLYATENDTEVETTVQAEGVYDERGNPALDEHGQYQVRYVERPSAPSMRTKGWYDHGMYPFVFDALFPEAGMPVGFGFVDVCKNAQTSIDIYNNAFEKNVQFTANPRYLTRNDGGMNETEFADPNALLVHTDGNLSQDSLVPITPPTLVNSNYIAILNQKIDELKETAGNRDTTNGGTASGVTAASAIAAMQEQSGKTSRDQIKTTYRAYEQVVTLAIELIRQFYDLPREFRITGQQGQEEFVSYSNAGLQPKHQGVEFGQDMGYRLPVFDIRVEAQKESAYSQLSQNELALQFYGNGMFNPQYADQALVALDMMEFTGKQQVVQKVQRNGGMYQQMLLMQQQMLQMAETIDSLTGGQTRMAEEMAKGINRGIQEGQARTQGGETKTAGGENAVMTNARQRASQTATPR
ncbi:portal protein [Wansuia hejianensis]|uniref:Portal protein n=1 Tax=Wansuia hejianensis TaxID=2763667 RepID=A0A7G9GB57_9FIRM|nr:hypothetical protein [Wansuia hejianensis]QNM08039.1 hypothetical protein H9Q79_14260 [Wansuia hejianensis]RHV86982.1 hypothetical protein DXA96_14440 [Lachnospiraceae bacterium OF09-33XD]